MLAFCAGDHFKAMSTRKSEQRGLQPATEQRATSFWGYTLRSVWMGLYLGLVPTFSACFWFALLPLAICRIRLPLVACGAAIGLYFAADIDASIEPLALQYLQLDAIRPQLVSVLRIGSLDMLHLSNSLVLTYTLMLLAGLPLLFLARLCINAVKWLIKRRLNHQPVIAMDDEANVTLNESMPSESIMIETESSIVDDLAVIESTVAESIDKPRTIVVHASHSNSNEAPTLHATEADDEVIVHDEASHVEAWSNLTLDEFRPDLEHSIESVVSELSELSSVASSHSSNVISISKSTKPAKKRFTVKETIIDIVRWKKSTTSTSSNASINMPITDSIATVSSTASVGKLSALSSVGKLSELASNVNSESSPTMSVGKLSELASSQHASSDRMQTISPPAIEPLPFLVGYLTNIKRTDDKPGAI
jgi:hypothetical protein